MDFTKKNVIKEKIKLNNLFTNEIKRIIINLSNMNGLVFKSHLAICFSKHLNSLFIKSMVTPITILFLFVNKLNSYYLVIIFLKNYLP